MTDIVVTVPKTFTYSDAPGLKGLAAWIAEGDAAGDPDSGILWGFTVGGARPCIEPGERVYIVCEGKLRGWAPLVRIDRLGARYWELVRGGGAVACTLPAGIQGFQGWRYRWWDLAIEKAFPDWRTP